MKVLGKESNTGIKKEDTLLCFVDREQSGQELVVE